MKKVLFVATVTSHINAFHIPYLKCFKEKGYEVHVASKGNQKIEYCDKHFELPFERFPLKLNNIKTYKELKKIIDDNQYEIVHSHTPVGGILARLAARKARKKYRTKSIYTAHGFHFYKGAPLKNWLIYYPIEKACTAWTDCLITITKEDYELAKKKFNIKQIEYIHGIGMNVERLQKDFTYEEKIAKRKELNLKKEDLVFAYIAELNKNKNQIMLIEVIKRLKEENINSKLLLIGDGTKYEEYKNWIAKYGLEDNVFLLGRRKDINDILSITDIYLASSIREGLPINVMEAMYKGLPIIAKDNRGHRELIMDEKIGYLCSNIDEFERCIIKIANEKSVCREYIKENSQQYAIDNVIIKMKKIYGI